MKFEQYGGYAKLGYDINSFWKVWGDVNVTHFNASNPGTIQVPLIDNDSRITRGMTSFALENHYEKTSGALSFFYNWGRHKINDGYQIGKEPQKSHFNSKDKMLGVSWYQSATLFTGNRLTLSLIHISIYRLTMEPLSKWEIFKTADGILCSILI